MRKSISRKRESIFLLMLTALVLLSIVLTNGILIFNSQKKSYFNQYENVTSRISDSLEETVKALDFSFTTFFMNDDFQKAASNIQENVAMDDFTVIDSTFQLLISTNPTFIKGCMFVPIGNDNELNLNNLIFNGIDILLVNRNLTPILEKANDDNYLKGGLFYQNLRSFDDNEASYFVLARNILSINNDTLYKRIGLGLLCLNCQYITNILNYTNQFQGISAFVKADEQTLFSSSNIQYETIKGNPHRFNSSQGSINFLNWQLETYLDNNVISLMLFNTYASSFIIMFFVIVLFILLYSYISNKSRKSLDYLFDQFSSIKDNGELVTLKVTGASDVDKVITSYNEMVGNINSLNEEIQFEKEKSLMLQIESVEYQINNLQSQINKHFLINVLNIIRSLVNLNQTEKAKYCIENLSEFLRYSLTFEADSTIEKEIQVAKNYLNIQLLRYPLIKYEIHCDEGLNNIVIPKVLLQPIIENCFVHGLQTKKGSIIVRTYQRNSEACIEVENSQNELTKKDIDTLNSHLENLEIMNHNNEDNECNHGVALINIQKRLALLYGNQALLRFDLNENGNVIVRVILPRKENNNA